MIAYLKGKIIKKTPRGAIIQTGDIGYMVFLTQNLLGNLTDSAELFIHHQVKEDASDLYGFQNYEQLEFFNQLINISGIGPRLALDILNAPEEQIKSAIINGDDAFICKIPGIGKKTAQRIIIELKDKLEVTNLDREYQGIKDINNEAIEALTKLGYQRKEILNTLKDIPSEITKTEEIITYFLKYA
ncbi:Holliday junction branch migration protein RuvA [Candidatus Peregrinibacteria bacterium CG10_big_fil_rev_8_21_14_0_10_36_19]|nr:MAG: Holliday junction branch migration protein RuvA [Candidatus Peregrinibacteria bacterium CG10_big_fil_rev_8_21_14_0_10_36_19]